MTTTLTFNQFKSTAIYGTFSNVDSSNGSILADGKFKRNLTIEGNLILGKETILDANGNPVNSASTIQFTLDNVLYNIPLRTLSFIKNVTSDVQQQLTNISNGSSFSNITVSGLINGIKINNYSNDNTSFSSGNTDIFGNNNTRFGYFTGSLLGYSNAVFGDQSLQNCTGHSNTAIGHNSQNGNTSYNYNTSLGSNSNIIGGSSNIAIGHVAQCSNCSNSIVIGNSITSSTNNEILLGSSVHTVQIPGNINFSGKITQNIGNQNTAIGLLSFTSNTSGGYNTVFGYNSMTSNTGGAYCTAFGCNTLQTSNAFGNTAIGYNAGINVGTGTYNTFLGHNTTVNQVVSNSTAIGSNAICNASNQIMLGTSTENVVIPGNLTFNQSINNISTTIFGYLSGLTSNIQSSFDSIQNSFDSLPENFQTAINANNFAAHVEETYETKTFVSDFISFVEGTYLRKPSQLQTWYITGSGGYGTTPIDCKIGASTNIGGFYFNVVQRFGGASASAFSTSTAIFRAPVAGTYFFQLNIFKFSTNTTGRNLRFVSYSFMGNQYCDFNERSAESENAYQWTTMIYLDADAVAYFDTVDCPITLYYAPGHTNLTITKIF